MMNYSKLTALKPTVYATLTNSLGQVIELVEHPLKGDEYPVIAICHKLQLASATDFYECDDMIAEHKEYEPIFLRDKFQHGYDAEAEFFKSHPELNP